MVWYGNIPCAMNCCSLKMLLKKLAIEELTLFWYTVLVHQTSPTVGCDFFFKIHGTHIFARDSRVQLWQEMAITIFLLLNVLWMAFELQVHGSMNGTFVKRGAMDGGVDGISTDKKWEISRLFGRVPACSSDISKIVWLANLMAVHVYKSELWPFLWNYITDHGVLSLSIPYQKGHQFLRPCHGLGILCPTDRQPQGYRIGFYKEPMVDDDFWPTFATWLRWMKSSRYAALPMIKMEHVCRVIPSTVFCFHQTLNIRIVCPVQSCILQELPLKEFE